jgi:hypothetical protein
MKVEFIEEKKYDFKNIAPPYYAKFSINKQF